MTPAPRAIELPMRPRDGGEVAFHLLIYGIRQVRFAPEHGDLAWAIPEALRICGADPSAFVCDRKEIPRRYARGYQYRETR